MKLLLLSISIFFENQYRSIDFRSINVSIFDKFSSLGILHIILDQFWALNTNPAIFFSKIDISIFTTRSINVYIDFRQILESRHVTYHSGSVLGPEHESGNICSMDRSIYRFSSTIFLFLLNSAAISQFLRELASAKRAPTPLGIARNARN